MADRGVDVDPAQLGPDDPFGDGVYLDPRAHILQRNSLGYVTVDGVQCDVDVALTANYGQWNYQPPAPTPSPVPAPGAWTLDDVMAVVLDNQMQLRGPALTGWPQLGGLTLVDAVAKLLKGPTP